MPLVCWKKQNLRYLQCRNLTAAQLPYVTKSLTTTPELYVTYSAETWLQCLKFMWSTMSKLHCSTWTLRHPQCRNLTAAQVPYVTRNLTTEPELYVIHSAQNLPAALVPLLLVSVMHVFTWIAQLLSQWRYANQTPQTLADVVYSVTFQGSCKTYKSSLRGGSHSDATENYNMLKCDAMLIGK
jgi:hypothetical protein